MNLEEISFTRNGMGRQKQSFVTTGSGKSGQMVTSFGLSQIPTRQEGKEDVEQLSGVEENGQISFSNSSVFVKKFTQTARVTPTRGRGGEQSRGCFTQRGFTSNRKGKGRLS